VKGNGGQIQGVLSKARKLDYNGATCISFKNFWIRWNRTVVCWVQSGNRLSSLLHLLPGYMLVETEKGAGECSFRAPFALEWDSFSVFVDCAFECCLCRTYHVRSEPG